MKPRNPFAPVRTTETAGFLDSGPQPIANSCHRIIFGCNRLQSLVDGCLDEIPEATRVEFGVFRDEAQQFAEANQDLSVFTFGQGTILEQAKQYESDLRAWQERLGKLCASIAATPLPTEIDSNQFSGLSKVLIAGGLVIAAVLIIRR